MLTYRNTPQQAPPHPRENENRFDRAEPFLHSPDVRYYGEPVALVIAETFEDARHAASLLIIRYSKDASAQVEAILARYSRSGSGLAIQHLDACDDDGARRSTSVENCVIARPPERT